jgi:hypothetical protein
VSDAYLNGLLMLAGMGVLCAVIAGIAGILENRERRPDRRKGENGYGQVYGRKEG